MRPSIQSILLGALLLTGCAAGPEQAPRALPDTGMPALHAVNDTRLRELMAQMNSLLFERFMTEHELDKERRKHARQIAAAAVDLDHAIDAILARQPALQLNAAEQTPFTALAAKLREQARELKLQADANQIDALPAMLERMTHTCTACHELFRKL
jgi:hypothetical protein